MTIYAWPPVGITGWELTTDHGVARSEGTLAGRTLTSSSRPARRLATAVVLGIGPDGAGAGYVESLKDLIKGGEHFVRVECMQALWWNYADRGVGVGSNLPFEWLSGAGPSALSWGGLLWSTSGAAVGTPTTLDGFPALEVSGFAPGAIAAYPHEYIRITDGTTTQGARAVTMTHANESGVAVIKLHTAVTISGAVNVGAHESIVFSTDQMPRSVQNKTGSFNFEWSFREVLPSEYSGHTEVNPW